MPVEGNVETVTSVTYKDVGLTLNLKKESLKLQKLFALDLSYRTNHSLREIVINALMSKLIEHALYKVMFLLFKEPLTFFLLRPFLSSRIS